MEVESYKLLGSFYRIWSKNGLFHIEDTKAPRSFLVSEAHLEWFSGATTKLTRGLEDCFFQKFGGLNCDTMKHSKFRSKEG